MDPLSFTLGSVIIFGALFVGFALILDIDHSLRARSAEYLTYEPLFESSRRRYHV